MPNQTSIHQQIPSTVRPVIITSQTVTDEIISFFHWWYIEMPVWYVGMIQRVATICDDTLSTGFLFKTFFVPWHKDNSWIGYFFGITIRIIYLPIALLLTTSILIFLTGTAIIWALVPPLATYFIIKTPFL